MGEKPIFKDCAIPADCECAKRGYELERDSCAVPGVAAAAAALGVPSAGLFGDHFRYPVPPVAADLFGTVQPLPNSGDLAKDVRRALGRLAAGRLAPACPLDRDDLDRIISYGKAVRSVQAEAGVGSANVEILFTSSEELKSGRTLMCWIVLGRANVGDSLYWMLTVRDGNAALNFGNGQAAEFAYDLLLSAGGGSAGERKAAWADAPTEADIKAID